MKKFWLVLLSLGLIIAFSTSALAVEVKVGAEYYAGGLYLNKTSFISNGLGGYGGLYFYYTAQPLGVPALKAVPKDVSTAFFYQRLRVGTDFIVSPCLKLVTQFDAMERIWGGARYTVPTYPSTWTNQDAMNTSAGTRSEAENIAFNTVYIDYTSPVGQFKVGYQPDYVFGTVFADNGSKMYDGQIQYYMPVGPFTIVAGYSKITENSWSAVSSSGSNPYNLFNAQVTDTDYDSYRLAVVYNFKNDKAAGDAGVLFLWDRDASHRIFSMFPPYMSNVYTIDPYVKAKIGPVSLQAELLYSFGDAMKWDVASIPVSNVSISTLSVFVDAVANLGQFSVGATAAYLSGQDQNKYDQITGGINTAGYDWNPCLIMFNTETVGYWAGPLAGFYSVMNDKPMSNAWFFQGRAGMKPTPQWDILLSLSFAQADKKTTPYMSPYTMIQTANGTYGTEIDLTATYKITNNLSYMLGGAYLFTGDYFKGPEGSLEVNDNYMLINKLTLSF